MPSVSIDINVLNSPSWALASGPKGLPALGLSADRTREIQTSTRRAFLNGYKGGTSPARPGLAAQGLAPCG